MAISNAQRGPKQNHQATAKRKTKSGLSRPKRTITYGISSSISLMETSDRQHANKSNSARGRPKPSSASKPGAFEPIVAIARAEVLLNLVHRRNRNQHRNQPFFKWLNLLRRACKHLLHLLQQHMSIEEHYSKNQAASNAAKNERSTKTQPDAKDARRKFEQQAEIRSQREIHEEWMRETLVPNAYVAFTSLVADSQFAHLGLMLVGVVSDIASIVRTPKRIDKSQADTTARVITSKIQNTQLTGTSTIVTGPDLGEVTQRMYDSLNTQDPMDVEGASDIGILISRPPSRTKRGKGNADKNPSHLDPATSSASVARHTTTDMTAPQILPEKEQHPLRSDIGTVRNSSNSETSSKTASIPAVKSSTPLNSVPRVAGDATVSQSSQSAQMGKKHRKKKKKGNAIDDLFSGFG